MRVAEYAFHYAKANGHQRVSAIRKANIMRKTDGLILKVSLNFSSMRVAEYAFHYAKANGHQRVSAIHKANTMRKTDGLFLKCCREVAEKYPEKEYEEVIIDNCCMMLVKNPTLFDVLVMPKLYGDIITDLCADLIGGLGLTPSPKYHFFYALPQLSTEC